MIFPRLTPECVSSVTTVHFYSSIFYRLLYRRHPVVFKFAR